MTLTPRELDYPAHCTRLQLGAGRVAPPPDRLRKPHYRLRKPQYRLRKRLAFLKPKFRPLVGGGLPLACYKSPLTWGGQVSFALKERRVGRRGREATEVE